MLLVVQSSGRGTGILDAKASVSWGAAYQPRKAYDDVHSGRSVQPLLNMQPRCVPAHTCAHTCAHTHQPHAMVREGGCVASRIGLDKGCTSLLVFLFSFQNGL